MRRGLSGQSTAFWRASGWRQQCFIHQRCAKMDVGCRKVLQFLGQNINRLRNLHAGLPVQSRLQNLATSGLAKASVISVSQDRSVAGPQTRRTGQTKHMVGRLSRPSFGQKYSGVTHSVVAKPPNPSNISASVLQFWRQTSKHGLVQM